VWNICNTRLQEKDFSVRGIINASCVNAIVTTDDPVDSLEHHEAIQGSTFGTKVYPGWRPDKLLYIERNEFLSYIEKLRQAAEVSIDDMEGLKKALHNRLDFFEAHGCRASDHGINEVVYAPASAKEVDSILRKRLEGSTLTPRECNIFRYSLLRYLGYEYAKRGWVMEIHFGALRNNNTYMFKRLGPDTGYDCINNCNCISGLVALLDSLEQEGCLPKVILFSLNPNDNAAIVSAIGCFSEAGVSGKVQHGPAWWFNDNKSGMEQQIINLANMSVLGNFVGMLTDSRSFLSYTRHEYFRRILCNLLGGWVEAGEYPHDNEGLGKLVEDVSYYNAMRYFGF
jgi:glucuronate isomerase